MSLSINIGRPFLNDKTLDEQARSVLRLYGSNAHVYLPGANGVAVSGLPTNNYTLSDGSTGYSAVDGTAGRVLDGAGSVGSELINQSLFAAGDAGALVSANASAVTVTNNDPTAAFTTAIGGPLVVGKTYKASWNLNAKPASGNARILCGGYDSGNTIVAGASFVFITASSTAALILSNGGSSVNGESSSWSSVSLIEVTGIHATQATTANKPALRRGLYNLLTYSQDFTNAAWSKSAVTATASGGLAPTTTGATEHSITQTGVAASASTNYTVYAKVKKGVVDWCAISQYNQTSTGARRYFNLATSSVGSNDNFNGGVDAITPTIADAGDGYWIIALTQTGIVGTTSISVRLASANADLGRLYSSTDTTSAQITVAAFGLTLGTLTAAQILSEGGIPLTTSAAASNQSAGRYWWQFASDSLGFAAPFAFEDDHAAVIAIANGGAGATYPYVLSSIYGATANVVALGNANGGLQFRYKNDAATLTTYTVDAAYTGAPIVVALRKSGGHVSVWKNGVLVSTSAAPTGVFTVGNGGVLGNGGSIGGTGWSGDVGSPIFIKGAPTDADMLTLQRIAAQNFPNAPTF